MTTPKLLNAIAAAGLLIGCFAPIALAENQPKSTPTLKGGVQETGRYEGLTRQEVKKPNEDPFASGEDIIDAPKSAFKEAFKGKAQQGQQTPMGTPLPMGGEDDEPAAPQAPPQPAFNPNDPDSSPDMKLMWDLWHKRVASTIFDRFNFFAKAAFKRSPPLLAELSYVVTRDGRIQNIQIRRKSTNVLFNVLIFQAVKSLDGDLSVLAFPQGSRRMFVPKSGTFAQNYGPTGFRYATGDAERIPGK